MRILLALLLTLALVFPLILAAQALISVNSFILDRNFYIEVLDSDQVYGALTSDSMINLVFGNYFPLPADADLSKVDSVIKSVITRDYLKGQVENFVNGFFDYLQGKTNSFEPMVNLIPIKEALSGPIQDELLVAIASILPVCQPGQTPGLDTSNKVACKPSGISDEILAKDYLKPIFPVALSQIPDEMPIGKNWNEIHISRYWGPMASGMALPASLMLVTLFLAFIAASFWYISALIASSSWRVRLEWLGWTLIIPSGLIFLIGLMIKTNLPNYWINFGLNRATFSGMPFSSGLREVLRAIVSGSLSSVSSSFLMVCGISAAFGLGFIFWGLATKK
jgi:hypothetical protein